MIHQNEKCIKNLDLMYYELILNRSTYLGLQIKSTFLILFLIVNTKQRTSSTINVSIEIQYF